MTDPTPSRLPQREQEIRYRLDNLSADHHNDHPACQCGCCTFERHAGDDIEYLLVELTAARLAQQEAQKEADILHHSNIIEIAVRNQSGSVSEYMNHWETRALKAEVAQQEAERQRDAWRSDFERETRIVDNVWGALNISTYEQAQGKDIATLVSEQRELREAAESRLTEAERLLGLATTRIAHDEIIFEALNKWWMHLPYQTPRSDP